MSSGIILSFPNGEEILQMTQESAEAAVEFASEEGDMLSPVDPEHKKNILDKIDRLRHLVEEGRCDGLVLIVQDPITGYFLTEVCLDPAMNRSELFGFMGVIDTVKMEISENAAMAPVMTLTGTVLDPYCDEDALE